MSVNTHTTFDDVQLQARLAKNQAFWDRAPAERPLFGTSVNITFPATAFGAIKTEKGRILPDMIDPGEFLSDWDRSYAYTEARGEDVFMVANAYAGIPWMEAIAGCEVYSSPTSGSIWAEHPNPDWDSLAHIGFDPNHPWLLKLLEYTRVLREHSAGRYPIAGPIMRGVSDMVAALLGPQRMVFEIFDHPRQVRQLIARCTEIWQAVGQLLGQARGFFHGGQCADRRRVWAEGTCKLYQDDAASLLSPAFYQEYFIPAADAILRAYDRTMIHTHSASLRIMLDSLLALDSLSAIEVVIDPTGPDVTDLIPTFKQIQAVKGLLLIGEMEYMSLDQVHTLITELSPRGLCILSKVNTEAEADAALDELLSFTSQEIIG
jgi:hypothetical protein